MDNMPPTDKFEFNHSVYIFNQLYSKLLLYLVPTPYYNFIINTDIIHGNDIVLYRRNLGSVTNKKISFVLRVIYLVTCHSPLLCFV